MLCVGLVPAALSCPHAVQHLHAERSVRALVPRRKSYTGRTGCAAVDVILTRMLRGVAFQRQASARMQKRMQERVIVAHAYCATASAARCLSRQSLRALERPDHP